MAQNLRPSPTESATSSTPGTVKFGNDGRTYEVIKTLSGIHRWVYTTKQPTPLNLNWRFNIGDNVKVIVAGWGLSPSQIGQEFEIIDCINYGGYPGYKLDNQETAAENSFSLANEKVKLTDKEIKQIKELTKVRKMATKLKTNTTKTAIEVRNIETSLINKEEVFKMIALAEATGLPLLLIGEPGTAKTKTIIEYAKAWLNKDGQMKAEDFANKIYVLETDEGTKASEIKGMPDLSKLFVDNKYEVHAPIAEADIIVINEVDKASSAIRNAMLGVMNEKFLFNGKHKIPCKWKLFVATCNEIPKDEIKSPFWDRFMLKMVVNRVSAGEISRYYAKGARDYREKFSIGIPNKSEIESVEIINSKLDKYLEVGYQYSSDRTLTFVPRLTKAVSFIWNISVDKALVKTAQIMIGQTAGSELQNKLMSPEVKAVMSKVEMLHSYHSNEQLELAIAEIESLINTYTTRGIMDESQVHELEISMGYILSNHPSRTQPEIGNEMEQEMMMSEATGMSIDAGSFQ